MARRTGAMPPPSAKRGAPPVQDVRSLLEAMRPSMGAASGRIADLIMERPQDVVAMTLTELAEATKASESLVIKLIQQLGVGGLQALKLSLAQGLGSPTQVIHEDLDEGDDVASVIQKVFHANIQALQDTLKLLRPETLQHAVDIINAAERVELYGIGSAAPIAEDAHYRMMRIGLNTRVTHDSHLQAVSAALATPRTAIITISHSGSTLETLAATRIAKEAGAKVIVITGYKRSPIQKVADVVLQTLARETKFRTEAMTSRIAQLSIVDALIAALALTRHDEVVDTLQTTFNALSSKRT
jgi:RpiR family carbohydrate utilization transcriptional regulator